MNTETAESSVATPEVRYAGFWQRAVAFAVDLGVTFLLFSTVAIMVAVLLGPRLGVPSGAVILVSGAVIWLVTAWLYWALMESGAKQGTVGKDLLGIVVVDAAGNRLSFGKATLRHLSKAASALPVLAGFIMVGFTAKKQGLHDLITGSCVLMRQQGVSDPTPSSGSRPNAPVKCVNPT